LKKLPNLDPLRFLLAMLVLIFHLPQLCKNQGLPYFDDLAVFHRGIEAVYMFFVLSGFLIIRLIYKAKLKGSFSIKNFYMRRILRISPLYYLILFFGLFFYNILLPFLKIPFEVNYTITEALFLCVFFLPNVFADLYEPGGILEVLWSIGIEEQFYILIAPLLFFVRTKRVLMILFGLLIGYFIVSHIEDFLLKKYHFYYFYLFLGGIIGVLEEMKKLEFLKKLIFFPLIITVATILYFFTDLFMVDPMWLHNLITCIIFGFFIHTISFNNKNLEDRNKWLNYFGQISYGIYMYYVIALNFVVFLFLKIDKLNILNEITLIVLINAFTIIVTLIFAHISYKYFEVPFLKLKNKFRE